MTANINWNSIYTTKIFKTFFNEFTKQSNTALSLGTLLMVFNGRSTLRTLKDFIVDKLAAALLSLKKKLFFIEIFYLEKCTINQI